MQGRSEERQGDADLWMVERAVVLQILREDHAQRWERAELTQEISDFDQVVLEQALAHLEGEGVLHGEGSFVWASRAARRLDELELISI